MKSLFDVVGGLPVHPLVVHVSVVLLPLAALSLAAAFFSRWWRDRFTGASFVALTLAFVMTFVAKESGEALERRVGDPGDHARYGDLLVPVAFALWVLALAWLVARRRSLGVLGTVAGALMTVMAIVVTGLTILVGHSGAAAVWESRIAAPAPSSATPSGSPTGAAQGSASGYTMAVVAKHKDASSCYAVVDKNVYDLTTWIDAHPGGRERILALCGTDATSAFTAQHGGETGPQSRLASFKVGPLAAS